MKRLIILVTVLAAGAFSIAAAGYQQPSQGLPAAALAATQIEKVKDNLYMITGADPTDRNSFSGGNTGVFITDNGVVVVDTKLAGWGQVILDKIKTVTNKPVTTIINTHTHGDHTGSNEAFDGTVEFVAHENTKANMAKMDAFKGDKAQFLPKKTFKDKMTIGSGKDRIDMYYFGRGHTNGDAWIVYPALRVMQTGDMFAWKDAPLLDRANGGSGLEYAATIGKALATVKNVDTLIVGHSPLRKPAELKEYQQFMTDFVAAARQAKAAGKTAEDAENPGWGKPILDKIKTLTDKPVTTLINTHTHGDHVSGNVEFPATVDVIAQENTKANMEKMPIFKEHNNAGMAKKTFKDKMTIGKGADEIDLYYFGRGHTNGDAFIVFPALRTMHAGDIFAGKSVPLIDEANGGSMMEISGTLMKAYSGIKNVDTIINGHTPAQTTFADLKDYADFNKDLVTWMESELKGGKTPEQAAAEWKLPEKYKSKGYAENVGALFGGLAGRIQTL